MSAAIDENDRAKSGILPADPLSGCEPANDVARKIQEERAKIYTVRELLTESHRRVISKVKPKALTTGHWRIDYLTGGIRPKSVWVIGADTSWGKSSFAIAIADENIKLGAKVLIASFEDSESLYADRLMVRRARVSAARYRDRALAIDEHRRVAEVVAQAEDVPVFFDAIGMQAEKFCAQVKRAIEEHHIDLVIVDYLQEVGLKKKCQDERTKYKEIMGLIGTTIKRAGVSAVILSQLTITDTKKVPDKHSIRESRDVANKAECILIGYTPEQTLTDELGRTIVEAGTKCIKVDKCKDGQLGLVALKWDSTSAAFDRVDRLEQEREQFHDFVGFAPGEADELDDLITEV